MYASNVNGTCPKQLLALVTVIMPYFLCTGHGYEKVTLVVTRLDLS